MPCPNTVCTSLSTHLSPNHTMFHYSLHWPQRTSSTYTVTCSSTVSATWLQYTSTTYTAPCSSAVSAIWLRYTSTTYTVPCFITVCIDFSTHLSPTPRPAPAQFERLGGLMPPLLVHSYHHNRAQHRVYVTNRQSQHFQQDRNVGHRGVMGKQQQHHCDGEVAAQEDGHH